MTSERPAIVERSELRELLRLSFPLILAFLGQQLLGFVDTAMVGRLGPAAIGGVGIGNGIFFTVSLLGMGCTLGMDPLISQALGADELTRARRVYWQGVRVAAIAVVPLAALILAGPLVLGPAGVDVEAAAATRAFIYGRVVGVVPIVFFAASRSYLQATGHTRAIVVSTIASNVANFFGDALLIYGDDALAAVGLPRVGLPKLGVFGAGLASSLSSMVAMLVLFLAVSAVDAGPDPDRRRADWPTVRSIVRLGLPIGLQLFIEVSAFAIASVLSGRIGKVAAAGNQLALTLASTSFMVPFGVSAATAVRVGRAVGRGDAAAARRAGKAGYQAAIGFMACSALLFILIPGALARIFTDKLDVVAAAVPLIQIAAVFQLSDGAQVVGAAALRGLGDTHAPFWANLVGHFVIGLPIAMLLAFGAGMGAPGLWWGLSAGLTVVGVSLAVRFARKSAGSVARV